MTPHAILSPARIAHDAKAITTTVDGLFKLLGGYEKPQIASIYAKARERLDTLLARIVTAATPQAATPDAIEENVFTAQHPDVLAATAMFDNEARARGIFARFHERHGGRALTKAKVIAFGWHQFSAFMPWFLCRAASKMSNNEKRHYVIQTAFEELGMRRVQDIHADMFWSAVRVTGLTGHDAMKDIVIPWVAPALTFLQEALEAYTSDEEVLGILLGLEIPATDNIETVFSGLAYDDAVTEALAEHPFFILHRTIEIEHVRLTVANYLRYCSDDAAKGRFHRGFQDGLTFWDKFWGAVASAVDHHKGENQE